MNVFNAIILIIRRVSEAVFYGFLNCENVTRKETNNFL